MIEFWNVVITAICSFIVGMAVHSAWLHSKNREEGDGD